MILVESRKVKLKLVKGSDFLLYNHGIVDLTLLKFH